MSSSYKKWNEEDDKLRGVIPQGKYLALIEGFEEKNTKGGLDKSGKEKPIYPMLVLDLVIVDPAGRERKMKDWVMLDGDMSWKFRHLACACGLKTEYEDDTLNFRMFVGKKPMLEINVKDGQDQNGNTVKRNNIVDYIVPVAPITGEKFNDDDISF